MPWQRVYFNKKDLSRTCPQPYLAKLSFHEPGWHASGFRMFVGRSGFSGVTVAYLTHLGA